MYTIYKQDFLFTKVHNNWEWKHLVPNGNPSHMTFHLLYFGQYPNLFDLGPEWNVIQSLVGGVDFTQMHLCLFDEHGACPIHSGGLKPRVLGCGQTISWSACLMTFGEGRMGAWCTWPSGVDTAEIETWLSLSVSHEGTVSYFVIRYD